MEEKLNAQVGRMEERMVAMESTMEEMTAEVRAITREFRRRSRNRDRSSEGRREFQAFGRARDRRTRNQHRSSEGRRDSVNAGRERRPPKNWEKESEDEREVRRSWRTRVELPTFEGADPMGWIAQAEKLFDLQSVTEKEMMKLVYRCMEGGLTSFWFRFWRKKTTHPTWKRFTDDLMRRFGRRNRDTVVEELAVVRKKGSVDENIQELETLRKPDQSSCSVFVDLKASITNGVEVVGATERRSDTYLLIGDQLDLGSIMMNSDCLRNDKETEQNNSANKPFDFKRNSSLERKLNEDILSSQERRVRDWHFTHLEHDCAASLNNVSPSYWNHDEVYRSFGGDHCMIKRGHSFVVEYLGEGITIPLNHVVTNVSNDIKEPGQNYKIKVSTTNGNDFFGDIVLLGCLKAGTIHFYPPLPQWKCFSAKCFSYETLNTVVLEFPNEVWNYVGDYFEATDARRNSRGHYFMFCNVCNAVGAPAIIALEVGKVAIDGQSWSSSDHLKHALKVLQKNFGQDPIPNPVTYVVTDWDIVWGAMMSGLRESVRKMDILSTGNEYIVEMKGLEIRDKLYLFELEGLDVNLGATCLASLGKKKVDWWQLSLKIEQEEWKTSVEDSRSEMFEVDRIQEESKILEEDLPPPKPPDLNWRVANNSFLTSTLRTRLILRGRVMLGIEKG